MSCGHYFHHAIAACALTDHCTAGWRDVECLIGASGDSTSRVILDAEAICYVPNTFGLLGILVAASG